MPFGGALPWGRRILVEDRWISSKEFTEIVTICQAVPGPNMVNLAVFVGTCYHGIVGADCVRRHRRRAARHLLALNAVYHSFAHLPPVRSAMTGHGGDRYGVSPLHVAQDGGGFWRRPLALHSVWRRRRWHSSRTGTWRWCCWSAVLSVWCCQSAGDCEIAIVKNSDQLLDILLLYLSLSFLCIVAPSC